MEVGYPILPLAAGCPWSNLAPPHIKHCEENLCAWITAPANTWSNLAYLIVGVWLWRTLSKRASETSPGEVKAANLAVLFGPAALVTGVTSFLYHASYTYVFQAIDYVGMFMFSSLLIALNLRRLGVLRRPQVIPVYLALVAVGTLPFIVTGGSSGRSAFAVQISVALLLEIRLYFKSKVGTHYTLFWTTLGLFAAAYGCWWIDAGHVWCDPQNHVFQGHSGWHVFSALCSVPMAFFYRQFKTLN
ncbi:MAG: ceramidase domain-containing protein [Methylotenera sp.]|nr:ceramidase domain-containing protein [Oligoflexia bacterium]